MPRRPTVTQRILAYYEERPTEGIPASQASRDLAVDGKVLASILSRLAREGSVTRVSRGVYRAAAAPRSPPDLAGVSRNLQRTLQRTFGEAALVRMELVLPEAPGIEDTLHPQHRLEVGGTVHESKVFPFRPTHEEIIQRAQRAAQRRGAKSPVVANPSHHNGPGPTGNLFQSQIVAMMQPPATRSLSHRFGRFLAYRRCETDEELSLATLRPTRAKRVAQKVETLLRVTAPPVGILAVHDLGLVRVKFQATLRKPLHERIL